MNEMIEKSSKGHKVGSSGAALAILCFFLPWILFSCGGQTVKMSGMELASGNQQVEGKPILFLVLLAGFGVLYLAYTAYKRGSLAPTPDGYGLIALGALPLLILFIQFSGASDQAAQQGVYVEYQVGLWGVVIGYLAVIFGGYLNLKK